DKEIDLQLDEVNVNDNQNVEAEKQTDKPVKIFDSSKEIDLQSAKVDVNDNYLFKLKRYSLKSHNADINNERE
ncbi:23966_t:CDS:2, partial [Cetraspora pellucida]